jgi:hypothetical protein
MQNQSERNNRRTGQPEIDRNSFQLGMINCFVEMVACGVKKMAISPPLMPEDYQKIRHASDEIVKGFGINSYLEKSLLITDLQSEAFTRGKWSVLYYQKEEVLAEYMDLKQAKETLEHTGRYDADARKGVSRAFMRLLSYPEDKIEEKLSGNAPDPFVLIDI